jgi:hypothetical protein
LSEQLADLRSKKASALKRFAEEMTEEELLSIVKSLNNTISKVEIAVEQRDKAIKKLTDNTSAQAMTVLQRWDSLSIQERRKALKDVMPMMLVRNDRIEFWYANYLSPNEIPLTRGKHGKWIIDVDKAINDLRGIPFRYSSVELPPMPEE